MNYTYRNTTTCGRISIPVTEVPQLSTSLEYDEYV